MITANNELEFIPILESIEEEELRRDRERILEIEYDLIQILELQQDIGQLVVVQGEQLDQIADSIVETKDFVMISEKELEIAEEYHEKIQNTKKNLFLIGTTVASFVIGPASYALFGGKAALLTLSGVGGLSLLYKII